MISLKDDFIKKSKALGRDAIEANSVYNLIEKFAEYGFNKSHSIAYATLAYQMAYLKANYYLEFMCVKLNKNIAFSLEVSEAISSLIVNGVKILPPNLFYSLDYFYINQDRQLVIPLSYIRTIGKTQAKQLVELKKTVGVLTFENYIKSSVMFLTRENILNLINSCALDSFGITHYEMTKYLDGLSYYLYQQNHGEDNNEFDFKYLKEEEFKSVNHNFKYNNFHNNYDFSGYLTLEATLVAVNEIKTKKGFPMAFIRIDDNVISIEIVCFSSVYQNIKHLLIVNKNYKFKVRKNEGQTIELISIS
jgi:DNA polymerase-3 subunit alpha